MHPFTPTPQVPGSHLPEPTRGEGAGQTLCQHPTVAEGRRRHCSGSSRCPSGCSPWGPEGTLGRGATSPAPRQHSSHRLSGFSLKWTFSRVSSPLCQRSTEQEGRWNFRNTGFASSAVTHAHRATQLFSDLCRILAKGIQGCKAWGPLHSMARLADLLSWATRAFSALLLKSHWGSCPGVSEMWWMGCLSPGKRAGPFLRAKSPLQNNPTIPASPCMLNHNFPVAEICKSIIGRAKHTAMASSLSFIVFWPWSQFPHQQKGEKTWLTGLL